MEIQEVIEKIKKLSVSFNNETKAQYSSENFPNKLRALNSSICEEFPETAKRLSLIWHSSRCSQKHIALSLGLIARELEANQKIDVIISALSFVRHVDCPGIQRHPQMLHGKNLLKNLKTDL